MNEIIKGERILILHREKCKIRWNEKRNKNDGLIKNNKLY